MEQAYHGVKEYPLDQAKIVDALGVFADLDAHAERIQPHYDKSCQSSVRIYRFLKNLSNFLDERRWG